MTCNDPRYEIVLYKKLINSTMELQRKSNNWVMTWQQSI